jgi:hypothetical protein
MIWCVHPCVRRKPCIPPPSLPCGVEGARSSSGVDRDNGGSSEGADGPLVHLVEETHQALHAPQHLQDCLHPQQPLLIHAKRKKTLNLFFICFITANVSRDLLSIYSKQSDLPDLKYFQWLSGKKPERDGELLYGGNEKGKLNRKDVLQLWRNW